MKSKQIYAVAVVVIIVVAAIGIFVILNNKDTGYRSTNTDGRLAVLGNANEDDYLDGEDVAKLESLIENGEYSLLADANNDGVVDQKDIDMVNAIIELIKYNDGKSDSQKKSMTINYITVDGTVASAKIPIFKMIVLNTQRSLSLAIAIGAADRVVGINDFIQQYWDNNLFKNYGGLPSVGDRREPSIEEILKIDADTVYSGTKSTYGVNIDGSTVGTKQVVRLTTWENGRLAEGALMLGFFTGNSKEAQEYVKWMDDLNNKINERLDKISNRSATKFYIGTPTYMYAQSDGVSTALSLSGATNVGNTIVTTPSSAGGSVPTYLESILASNPQYIVAGRYIYTHQSEAELKAIYESTDFSSFAITDGYKNNEIYMINYDLPFCIHTLIGSSIFFPGTFSTGEVEDILRDYVNKFCETNGYEFQMYNFVYYPNK
ncbi:MAG: ABC transporter substrate-binding protein [Methanomassiliicoccaceae archaeon]|nr:ABC transporter substrate-binding protein [Methanomassiliicoccaceae archaeon]